MNRFPAPDIESCPVEIDHHGITPVTDIFARPLKTLRVSVTDRCNFRCRYCMPSGQGQRYSFLHKSTVLEIGEYVRLIKIFAQLGVNKIRMTGGEPLLYPQLVLLIKEIRPIPGITDLALTTNGSLLNRYAEALHKAGLNRVTISLDTLDQKIFRKIRGRSCLKEVLRGIRAAEQAGFSPIKINVVIQRGFNEDGIFELVEYFRKTPHILRFIESMDVGNCAPWQPQLVVPNSEILKNLRTRHVLFEVPRQNPGDVARGYRFADNPGEIGFISAITQPFCRNCNRLRLSSEGKIYTCLFAGEGLDLRGLLRAGASDQKLKDMVRQAWQKRTDKYSEDRWLFYALKENFKKVEMYRIGG